MDGRSGSAAWDSEYGKPSERTWSGKGCHGSRRMAVGRNEPCRVAASAPRSALPGSAALLDKHGIDHEHGGLMCSLDYDGTRLSTGKNLWFLGRAIWVYSFLYNGFGKNPEFLDVAKRSKEFVFKYARQKDGWW